MAIGTALANFGNARLGTMPWERMRGKVIFAEHFVSGQTVLDNNGYVSDANGVSRGLNTRVAGGSEFYAPIIADANEITIVLRFKYVVNDTHPPEQHYNLCTVGDATDGWAQINLALHMNASIQGFVNPYPDAGYDQISYYPFSFDDGKWHTITMIVDYNNRLVTIMADDLEPKEEELTSTGSMALSESPIIITSGYIPFEIQHVVIYNDLLTRADHLTYHHQEMKDIYRNLHAIWRCNEFGDDRIGNQLLPARDDMTSLRLGDGSDVSTMPTLEQDPDAFYAFDGVNDYLSDMPSMPDAYTVSACVSNNTPDGRLPTIVQETTDNTFLTALTTPGYSLSNNVHSLVIADSELSELRKRQYEYLQRCSALRARCPGILTGLMAEGVLRVCLLADTNEYVNMAIDALPVCTTNAMSINVPDKYFDFSGAAYSAISASTLLSDMQDLSAQTIVVFGAISFSPSTARSLACHLSTTNHFFITAGNPGYLTLANSSIPITDSSEMLAVSSVIGERPRFYQNESLMGNGDTWVDYSTTSSAPFNLGNGLSYNTPLVNAQPQAFLVFNQALTDREISALYYALKGYFK